MVGGCLSIRLLVPEAILVGLCAFALLSGCGRIGFDAAATEDDKLGIDSGPTVDAPPSLIDAKPAAIDAAVLPVDAMPLPIDAAVLPIDAALVCNVPVAGCPSESFTIGAGALATRSGQLANQADNVFSLALTCIFPLSTADYSYQINLQVSGSVTIGSSTSTGWYLLDAACGGNVKMCSSSGAMDTTTLTAGTYTLVVEDVGATGVCRDFEITFLASSP